MIEILTTELMTPNPTTIAPNISLFTALNMMKIRHYSCIIIAQENRPIGVITERDVVQLVNRLKEEPSIFELPVSSLMTSPVITISSQAHLLEALVLSRAHNIRHLVVTNQQEQVIGLLTQTDVNRAYFMIIEKQRETLQNAITAETQALKDANEELRALSLEDPLLGIGNRRSLNIDMQYTHQMTIKYHQPYSIMLIDVDYFKKYNDQYGHQKGDQVLQAVANQLKIKIRKHDRLYRYGGEEFLILMPNTNAADAYHISERMVISIAALNIKHKQSPYRKITVSVGVAFGLAEDKHKQWREIIHEADIYLYAAKRQGRNRALHQNNAITALNQIAK